MTSRCRACHACPAVPDRAGPQLSGACAAAQLRGGLCSRELHGSDAHRRRCARRAAQRRMSLAAAHRDAGPKGAGGGGPASQQRPAHGPSAAPRPGGSASRSGARAAPGLWLRRARAHRRHAVHSVGVGVEQQAERQLQEARAHCRLAPLQELEQRADRLRGTRKSGVRVGS